MSEASISKARSVDWRLYLATDNRILDLSNPGSFFSDLLTAGVTALQLRLKNVADDRVLEMAQLLHEVTTRFNVPLIINDRVDIMLESGADGVHVGRNDRELCEVRRQADDRIVGYSVNTEGHLRFAIDNGADYVGMGPVFATGTKLDTGPVLGFDGLTRLAAVCPLPCVGIGGVDASRIHRVMDCGVTGACVISAVLGAKAPAAAVRQLRQTFE